MRHAVLTRAVYDPALWPVEANERRLRLLIGITARSLASQDGLSVQFEWLVQLHAADPFRAERTVAVEAVGGRVVITSGEPGILGLASLAANTGKGQAWKKRQLLAASCYQGWRAELDSGNDLLLTTRVDDDDAFAPGALAQVQRAAGNLVESTIIVLPIGYRVSSRRFDIVRHETNAWQTYVAMPGDSKIVYDYPHREARQHAPLQFVSGAPEWLWVRHQDALSAHLGATRPLTRNVMDAFPLEWRRE